MLGREGELVVVGGRVRPAIEMTAGTTERWRVVNACVSRFLDLRLDGHTWGLLGLDGQALHAPLDRDTVLLAPGNRADLLVRPTGSGATVLRSLARDRGGMGMMGGGRATSPEVELAAVTVRAPRTATATPARDWSWPAARDLRAATVHRRRVVTMTGAMGMGGGDFGFDGRTFDPARTDQRLALGTVEEWTIGNATMMDHPFHLHVWPMQVVDAPDSDPDGPPDWRDVVVVPAMGQVTVRIPVRDFGGRTVYHCHVLDHEDLGMMGVVEAG
jgi:FtsP/CotA-like multicopper oxidase with cupredoxin domain